MRGSRAGNVSLCVSHFILRSLVPYKWEKNKGKGTICVTFTYPRYFFTSFVMYKQALFKESVVMGIENFRHFSNYKSFAYDTRIKRYLG